MSSQPLMATSVADRSAIMIALCAFVQMRRPASNSIGVQVGVAASVLQASTRTTVDMFLQSDMSSQCKSTVAFISRRYRFVCFALFTARSTVSWCVGHAYTLLAPVCLLLPQECSKSESHLYTYSLPRIGPIQLLLYQCASFVPH